MITVSSKRGFSRTHRKLRPFVNEPIRTTPILGLPHHHDHMRSFGSSRLLFLTYGDHLLRGTFWFAGLLKLQHRSALNEFKLHADVTRAHFHRRLFAFFLQSSRLPLTVKLFLPLFRKTVGGLRRWPISSVVLRGATVGEGAERPTCGEATSRGGDR